MAKLNLSAEKKLEIIKRSEKYGVSKVAQIYNISRVIIYKWKDKYQNGGIQALEKEKKMTADNQNAVKSGFCDNKLSFELYIKKIQLHDFNFQLIIKDNLRNIYFLSLLKEKTNLNIAICLDNFFSAYKNEIKLSKTVVYSSRSLTHGKRVLPCQKIAEKYNFKIKKSDKSIVRKNIPYIEAASCNKNKLTENLLIDLLNFNIKESSIDDLSINNIILLFKVPLIIAEDHIRNFNNELKTDYLLDIRDRFKSVSIGTVKIHSDYIKDNRIDLQEQRLTIFKYKLFAKIFEQNKDIDNYVVYQSNIAHMYNIKGDISKSIRTFKNILSKYKEADLEVNHFLYVYNYLCFLYSYHHNFRQSNYYNNKYGELALKNRKTDDIFRYKVSKIYISYFRELNNISPKAEVLLHAIDMYEDLIDELENKDQTLKDRFLPVIINNIANIYTNLDKEKGTFEKAINLYNKAIKICKEGGQSLAFIYNNIGIIYLYIRNLKEAEYYFESYKSISEKSGSIIHYADGLYRIAEINCFKKNYDLALKYYEQAEKIFLKNESYVRLAILYLKISQLYFKIKLPDMSDSFIKKAEKLFLRDDADKYYLMVFHFELSRHSLAKEKYKKAISNIKKATELNKSKLIDIKLKLYYQYILLIKELKVNHLKNNIFKVKRIVNDFISFEKKIKKTDAINCVIYFYRWKVQTELNKYKKLSQFYDDADVYLQKACYYLKESNNKSFYIMIEIYDELAEEAKKRMNNTF